MSGEDVRSGTEYGFIDHNVVALERFSPRLVTNDRNKDQKVITEIKNELNECDEFMFSVAFITESGIVGLLMDLDELRRKGIKGKIIASQYQNFTEPRALKKLLSFENIELRIVTEEQKMHSKCYIFRKENVYNIIIGSSNLTDYALSENDEWNLRISSTENGNVAHEFLKEFNSQFERATPVNESWVEQYSKIYEKSLVDRNVDWKHNKIDDINGKGIVPNSMQVAALESIDKIRSEGSDRALLISATGTGKTYLSAFDVKKYNPKRLLFLVHREVILKKAMESFKEIIGEKEMGILSGNSKSYDADYLFSTVQTMSMDSTLSKYSHDHFDYIIIDETHHAGAASYKKIIDYFKPDFILGMTATPERTDGFDIFKLFEYKIAYEIRLKGAMEQKMICPFHYFGISDLLVDGEVEDKEKFNKLVSDERVYHIIDRISFYGYSGNRVRGLMFCSRQDEAKELSRKFNAIGYRTTYLTSSSSQPEREEAIRKLEKYDHENGLDYIFVVDLFNEGIDIPSVNQVVMLRPTESPIIFTQQLGRGLRHSTEKEYLVVIDFIGNYDNNYLIPIALSGDSSYKKDSTRRFLFDSNSTLPGTSTISFDEITKERIFAAIDKKNFSEMRIITDAYKLLKQKMGKIPRLTDFKKFGSIDAMKFIERSKSYHNFLQKYDKDYSIRLSDSESLTIENLSKIVCNGKREHEIYFLELIMNQDPDLILSFRNKMKMKGVEVTDELERNLISLFTGEFFDKKFDIIQENNGVFTISENFQKLLKTAEADWLLEDILNFGKENSEDHYSEKYRGTNFVLNQLYSYEDVCRLLNWPKSVNALNIGGYKYDSTTNTFPVFINYVKGEDVVESQKYEDHFVNSGKLIAAPKSTENNPNAKNLQRIKNSEQTGMPLLLFVRKNKDDSEKKEFYYLGNLKFDRFIEKEKLMIEYSLMTPVSSEIYNYLVADIDKE